ncbi:F-box/LRR-repeat protein family [Quillaja saponaria]|uniref:F-box/LRR-repeat protein family n=1 Tax=Quillaja saponaria TaxID=32244 RepID=A0AAD7PW44_QUISA|nr:F-box/LRR-repeat protein family [Quillaja saponaria]
MDDLPLPLILEILSRLTDSADLARCRLASKTLNALSYEVGSINHLCSMSRYLKSRSPETKLHVTPFKTIFKDLVSRSRFLESVSIGVDKSLSGVSFDDLEDESNDLYLTDFRFMKEWLPIIGEGLRSLSISDFWVQSCWRRSEALSLISSYCLSLIKLEIKNAWLSVDGLCPMPTLTSLTLEFVRLDDEDLSKINNCFPSLRDLNLIGVGGLREPKIHLLHLRTCQWSVSNAPLSLTISAPNLVILKLNCIKPRSILLETPSLSDFYLSLENADEFKLTISPSLKCLQLESFNLVSLFSMFNYGETIEKLTLDSFRRTEFVEVTNFSLEKLFDSFPNLSNISLGPGAWSDAEASFRTGGLNDRTGMKALKEFVAHLVIYEFEFTLLFIFSILDKCPKLLDMSLLIPHEVDSYVASNLMSRCRDEFSRVRWRWGIWKEGTEDTWIFDGI